MRVANAQRVTLQQHARDDPRCFDDVVLDEVVQGRVARRRALQAQPNQELVEGNIDAMVVLSGRSGSTLDDANKQKLKEWT
jgi:hypothetical protein